MVSAAAGAARRIVLQGLLVLFLLQAAGAVDTPLRTAWLFELEPLLRAAALGLHRVEEHCDVCGIRESLPRICGDLLHLICEAPERLDQISAVALKQQRMVGLHPPGVALASEAQVLVVWKDLLVAAALVQTSIGDTPVALAC